MQWLFQGKISPINECVLHFQEKQEESCSSEFSEDVDTLLFAFVNHINFCSRNFSCSMNFVRISVNLRLRNLSLTAWCMSHTVWHKEIDTKLNPKQNKMKLNSCNSTQLVLSVYQWVAGSPVHFFHSNLCHNLSSSFSEALMINISRDTADPEYWVHNLSKSFS